MSRQLPVTILTGFLGSGKTTLLNRILREDHGHRIAVIENEFGEAGIDNDLLIQDRGEQIVEVTVQQLAPTPFFSSTCQQPDGIAADRRY